MRFIMSTDSVVHHLQLLRRLHCESRHILDSLRNILHVFVLVILQPRTFADPVVGHLQFTGFVVLNCRTAELENISIK